jgi:hypothetical protein
MGAVADVCLPQHVRNPASELHNYYGLKEAFSSEQAVVVVAYYSS